MKTLRSFLPLFFVAAVAIGQVPPPSKPAAPPNAKQGDLPPEEAQKFFAIPPDYAIELVAAEPLVNNPVSMALDEKGRIYFGESHTYRYGKEKSPVPNPTNPIVMLKPAKGGSGYERVIVAEGFDDPVMGLLVRDGRMWATSNDNMFCWDIDAEGKATNRRTLLTKGKGWNPFGFFALEFGPDGLIYLSMGSHDKIEIPGGQKLTPRGGGGIVCRMNLDGTKVELLTQGFRVPFAFEIDPFGEHWQLSNGEGNPNRFAKIINAPAADYHCFTRQTDDAWLSGANPMSPPAFAIQTGSYTSLLVYHGAAFPETMRGSLFAVNWGTHGRGTNNHAVDMYQPDARRNVHKPAEHWLTSADPHFRPTTILTAPDGSLLLSDFYNRDDESDLTGRIWRIKYVGSAPPAKVAPSTPIADLGHPDHLVRQRALETLLSAGNTSVPALADHAAKSPVPVGAATALWTLAQIKTPESLGALARGASHPHWQVRRLAVILAKRHQIPTLSAMVETLVKDPDPAVKVAAAAASEDPATARAALLSVLGGPSASEKFLRYEACWHLARIVDAATIQTLLTAKSENARLAGLIVIDQAIHERTAAAGAARQALTTALADPGLLEIGLLIDLASIYRSPDLVAPLKSLAKRSGLSLTLVTRTVLLLQALSGETHQDLRDVARKALAGLQEGTVPIKTDADRLAVLRLLPMGDPTPWAMEQIAQNVAKSGEVGRTANAVARSFVGSIPPTLMAALWKRLADPKTSSEQRIELLATVALLESEPDAARWTALLASPPDAKQAPDVTFPRELVRTWRRFGRQPALIDALVAATPALISRHPVLKEDLAIVFSQLNVPATRTAALALPSPVDEPELRKLVAKGGTGSVAAGRQVFSRAGCIACHSEEGSSNFGPALAGVGAQPREYLLESIFEPSSIIKTGFDTELVKTKDGQTLMGFTSEAGDQLTVTSGAQKTLIPIKTIQSRQIQKVSMMPQGLAKGMSAAELNDLLAYLQSLKQAQPPKPK